MHTNRLILFIILILLGVGALTFLIGAIFGPLTRFTASVFNATGIGYRLGDVPGQVMNLTGVSGDGQVTLIWSPPREGGSFVRYYKVYRGTDAEEIRFFSQTTETALNDTGLRNGTAYYYRVSAVSSAGEGALSPVVGSSETRVTSVVLSRGEGALSNEVRLVPRGGVSSGSSVVTPVVSRQVVAPRINILAGVPGDGYISLAWSLSSTGGAPVTSYRLYRRGGGGGEQLFRTLSESVYIDRDVVNGVSYTYRVTAQNTAGESSSSNEVTLVPTGAVAPQQSSPLAAPSPITNLTATPGNGQVYLLWSEPYRGTSSIVFYRVYRGLMQGNESPVGTTSSPSWTDSSVSNGVTYYYRVSAVNSSGESSSSNRVAATPQGYVYVTTPAAVSSPVTNLTATSGENSVSLLWTAPSSSTGPISQYRIYRSFSDGGYSFFASVSSPWYTDVAVSSGTTYRYYVTAVSGAGESIPSNTALATPFTATLPLGQVTNLVASPTNPSDGRTTLTWSSASGSVTGYRLYRSGGGSSETLLTSTSATSHTDTGLASGQSYSYRVRAYGAGGEGAFSNYAYVTTEQNMPGTVTDLRVSDSGDRYVRLVWSRPSGPLFVSSFRVLRGTVPGGESTIATISGLLYIDSSVVNDVTYYYRVQAINPGTGADGLRSNPVSATPVAPLVFPGQVTNLVASPTNPSDGRTTLTWSSASGSVTGYRLYRSGGGSSETLLTSTSATSHTDTGLASGQSYSYRVRAYGAGGEGAFSNSVSVFSQQVSYTPPPYIPPSYTPYTPPVVSQAPDRQLSLNSSSASGTQASLQWIVSSYGTLPVTHYRLSRGFAPYSPSTYFDLGFSMAHTDYGLTPGQVYYYWVTPMNGSVEGIRSNVLAVTIPFHSAYVPSQPTPTYPQPTSYVAPQPQPQPQPQQVQVPGSVTGLVADAAESGSRGLITLRWNPVAGATSYIVRRGSETLRVGETGTSFPDTTWNRWGASYAYSVEALNSAGTGARATVSVVGGICGGLSNGSSCGSTVYRSGGQTAYTCQSNQCIGTWSSAPGYADTTSGTFSCRGGQTWIDRSWNGKTGEWYVNSSCS